MFKLLDKERLLYFPLIINLSHQKGGVGKSTLAYNIAYAFCILGFKVKLLDIGIQNTCEGLNGLRKKPFKNIEKISNEKKLLKLINNSFINNLEIIIIDSGEFNSALSQLAIIKSNINLTPVSDRVTELLSVVLKYDKILNKLENNTNNRVSSYVLLNRIHPFAKDFKHIKEMIKNTTHMNMFKTIVKDRAIYDKSFIDGRTVFEAKELNGHKEAVEEILSICYELLEMHIKNILKEKLI
jgi:chromosome partitioning protein